MISVLVPYRPDGGQRERIWEWLADQWAQCLPGAEVIVECDDGGAHPGEFNHPLAINRAAARATGDVFVVADCDTWFDARWVHQAADGVAWHDFAWVMPRWYSKLDRPASEAALAGNLLRPPSPGDASVEWTGDSICWSGLVVVTRDAFEAVGGYDERIAWWGGDDICFGLTMDALVGKHFRLEGSATHLWHPQPIEQTYGHERHGEQQALVDRYIAAAEDPDAIRKVRSG